MVGDRVHHDTEGQDVTAHDEDAEQELAQAKELAAEAAQQNLAGVRQVLDVRVTLTHETDVVPGVSSEEAKADNQDDTAVKAIVLVDLFRTSALCWYHLRHQTQGGHRIRERQDTQRDRLANHEKTTLPVTDRVSLIFRLG